MRDAISYFERTLGHLGQDMFEGTGGHCPSCMLCCVEDEVGERVGPREGRLTLLDANRVL